jgi:hypothetical protein
MENRLPLMPLDARVADVLGLVDTVLNEFGGNADLFMVAKDMDSDLDSLVPALNASIYLGFLRVENGDVEVTELGRLFISSKIGERKRILKERLINLEPFRTAYELGLRGPFSVDELIEELSRKGYVDVRSPGSRELMALLLAEWGVFSGLLRRRDQEYALA